MNPIKPIKFTENFQTKPIVFMDKDINTEDRFAIMRTTAGGKFVRDNMLFYKINGVEIYTDINNIIFVDLENNTLFIKHAKEASEEIEPSDPETKEYILLYTDLGYEEQQDFPLRWEPVQGRINAYESIKSNASVIDIDKSIVLVDNVSLKDSLTVREFVNYLFNADIVDDDFDINEYAGSEYI